VLARRYYVRIRLTQRHANVPIRRSDLPAMPGTSGHGKASRRGWTSRAGRTGRGAPRRSTRPLRTGRPPRWPADSESTRPRLRPHLPGGPARGQSAPATRSQYPPPQPGARGIGVSARSRRHFRAGTRVGESPDRGADSVIPTGAPAPSAKRARVRAAPEADEAHFSSAGT
jgi:hypothetical protein